MDFFGIGTGEILLVLLVALIVFGPGRVAEIGRTLGRMMHTLKKASFDLSSQVTKELEGEETSRPPQSKGKSSKRTKPSSPSRSKRTVQNDQP